MKEKLKMLLDNIYLVAGGLFLVLCLCGFVTKMIPMAGLISGVTVSVLIIAFHYIFKPKWSEEGRKALLDSVESLKPFGDSLPLQIIGKLQLVFVIVMVVCLFRGILSSIIPGFPAFIFLVVEKVCYALFILGSFYAIFQGNIKTFTLTTKIFAFYQVFSVLLTFFTEKSVSVSSMCLFLAFYSLSYIFEYMLSEKDPEADKPVKEKKEKKPKKGKEEKEEMAPEAAPSEEAPAEEASAE